MNPLNQSFKKQSTIAIVGLGYVGLPLAVEFGKKLSTLGFDLSADKVAALREHKDPTGQVSTDDLKLAAKPTTNTGIADVINHIISKVFKLNITEIGMKPNDKTGINTKMLM